MKYAEPVTITSVADLAPLAEEMKAAARSKFDPAQVYSKTAEEAVAKAAPVAGEIFSSGKTRILNLTSHPGQSFCVVLTIEKLKTGPSWHFSLSALNLALGLPCHAPDDATQTLAHAFLPGVKESPPEGALRQVRHFYSPFLMS